VNGLSFGNDSKAAIPPLELVDDDAFFAMFCAVVEAAVFNGGSGSPPDADLTLYRVRVNPRRTKRDVDERAEDMKGDTAKGLRYIPIIFIPNAVMVHHHW
jgi:hypothetical protein